MSDQYGTAWPFVGRRRPVSFLVGLVTLVAGACGNGASPSSVSVAAGQTTVAAESFRVALEERMFETGSRRGWSAIVRARVHRPGQPQEPDPIQEDQPASTTVSRRRRSERRLADWASERPGPRGWHRGGARNPSYRQGGVGGHQLREHPLGLALCRLEPSWWPSACARSRGPGRGGRAAPRPGTAAA